MSEERKWQVGDVVVLTYNHGRHQAIKTITRVTPSGRAYIKNSDGDSELGFSADGRAYPYPKGMWVDSGRIQLATQTTIDILHRNTRVSKLHEQMRDVEMVGIAHLDDIDLTTLEMIMDAFPRRNA